MKKIDKLVLVLLLFMGVYHFGIGAYAYFVPSGFYEGASHKGAFNQHFIQDVGAAFLTAGAMLLTSAFYRPWRVPLTLAAGMFLTLHGLIHIYEAMTGLVDSHHLQGEILGVLVPTACVLVVSFYSAKNNTVGREEINEQILQ